MNIVKTKTLPFESVFDDVSAGNEKVQKSDYLPVGLFPVVDQGQQFIGGFSDDEGNLIEGSGPWILFGDHTRTLKYLDVPFCMGADGVKILKPKSTVSADTKYLFHFLRACEIPSAGYSRHFKFLKRLEIQLPPLDEQRRVAAILDKADALRRKRKRAIDLLNLLTDSIFFEMFGDLTANSKGWNEIRALGNLADIVSGTVDLVLEHLMQHGIKVEGGDRIGKTIIFAKNQDHAKFIEKRFNAAYPNLAGHFARVITHETGPYAQTLIDDFSKRNSVPHIAISVDMLDTGIDVPEVVNLVFFKQVRSKTKFWQMMGRGTRLCPDLFGPGQDKEFFRVFDYCQNLEFFGANPVLKEASAAKSLSERLFAARLDLVRALDEKQEKVTGFSEKGAAPYQATDEEPPSEEAIRSDAIKTLQDTVAGLNLDNFIVRRHRRAVEKYRESESWQKISEEARKELVDEIAPLPSANNLGVEEAKRFDLLMFSLELALLKGSKRFDTLKKQLIEIASALEDQTGIPAIAHQAVLIEEIQTQQWWEGVTVPLLELVRLRLRDLVQHIEKSRKAIVYSNFADEIGEGVEHELPQFGEADFARFKAKARHFLRAHEDHIVLHKLRQGRPLTPTDLNELERMLLDAGVGEAGDIERAREASQGFGRFVRSIVGLDRAAVSEAFSEFLAAGAATAQQIEFINMVIEHLTDQGVMDPELLYESPFIDVAPTGPETLFDKDKVSQLFTKIRALNDSAVA